VNSLDWKTSSSHLAQFTQSAEKTTFLHPTNYACRLTSDAQF
jgi:hypothetical protein